MMSLNLMHPTTRFGIVLLAFLTLSVSGCGYSGGYSNSGNSGMSAYTYTISGTIGGGATNNSGVTVTLTGGTAVAPFVTAAGGSYSFSGLANGTYTVTPTLASYTFTPSSALVTVYGGNMSTNFAESP